MDDLRDRMERLASRVDAAAAPDLGQVRERHARRRRTSALTVGVGLMVIVALLAIQVTRDGAPAPTPAATGGPSSQTLTIWPAVDTGATQWRSSPEDVITRFSNVVLGWSTPDIVERQGIYELRPEDCMDWCPPPLTVITAEVEPGVWSVRSVSHPDLQIEVGVADPAVALTAGSSVRFDLSLPDDRAGHIGMVASNGCRDATAFEIGLDNGTHRLELPAYTTDDPACDDMGAGYLFAYAMDDTTVPTGDPLREAAAIEYPWLTVIPIHLEMEEPDATGTATPAIQTPGVLEVSCYGDGLTSAGDSVLTQPDGVHLLVEGQNEYVEISIDDELRRIEDAPAQLVLPLEPGTHTVECVLPGADQVPNPRSFEVRDAQGYWVDPESLCTIAGIADFEPITVPEDGPFVSPVLGLFGLSEGSFEAVGYGASTQERIFVVFDGDRRPAGMVWFEVDPGGSWTSSGVAICA
jgi:hypothetical protein